MVPWVYQQKHTVTLINKVTFRKVNHHSSANEYPKPRRIFIQNLDVRHLVSESYRKFSKHQIYCFFNAIIRRIEQIFDQNPWKNFVLCYHYNGFRFQAFDFFVWAYYLLCCFAVLMPFSYVVKGRRCTCFTPALVRPLLH